jgi:predicted nuclease of predicted toxin-antitoxin system
VIIWVDAQLSPRLAPWLTAQFGVRASALRELGLGEATDRAIFVAARDAGAVILTKDSDFVTLLERYGTPPQVLWVTAGNTATEHVQALLGATWPRVVALVGPGERLVEITDQLGVAD